VQKTLQEFQVFDRHTIDFVNSIYEIINHNNYRSNHSEIINFPTEVNKKPIQIIDYKPRDYSETTIFNLPMGNGFNSNMLFWIDVLKHTLTDQRIIVFSNPAEPKQSNGNYKVSALKKILNGDKTPLIKPQIEYLKQQKINEINQIGYSLGTEKSLVLSYFAQNYDLKINHSMIVEPVSVLKRNLVNLAQDFIRSGKELKKYIEQAESKKYLEKFNQASKEGFGNTGYVLGILRLSNLVMAKILAEGNFENLLISSLNTQSEMTANIIWGQKSLICQHNHISEITKRVATKFPTRIKTMILKDEGHALADNIFLFSAIIKQNLPN
jgi:hypothetical protein